MKLPIIDFAKCAINLKNVSRADLKLVGDPVVDALTNIGFAYLKNVGIHRNQVEKTLSVAKKFFDLDVMTKQQYKIGPDCFGYIGIAVERGGIGQPGDLREAFDVVASNCDSNNPKWPDKEVSGFSSDMKDFSAACRSLSVRILEVLSLGMQVKDEDYLVKSHSRMNELNNLTSLRNLHYPPIPEGYKLEPGQVRLCEHTDFGSFTILFQDDQGGLQVKATDGTYVDATPIPGTVLVNVGNALQFWTRGNLKSTPHRICNTENSERRSLAYFVQANNEVSLSEIECGNPESHSPKPDVDLKEPPTVLEYLKAQYRDINLANIED